MKQIASSIVYVHMTKRKLVVSAVVGLFLALARAQFPDTPPARQFSAWLNAFNSGDRATLRQFFETSFPSRLPGLDQEMGFRNQTGGFDFKKAEESTETRFTGLVQERNSDQFGRFTVEVEAAEPHRITRMGIRAIPRPAEFPLPRLSESEAVAALRARIEKDAAADRFSGAVLVAKNGKAIFTGAY